MNITENRSEFDKRQLHLIREIIRSIKKELQAAKVPAKQLEDLTGNIAFSVAAIIDASRVMKVDGRPLLPVLTLDTLMMHKALTATISHHRSSIQPSLTQ